MHQIHHTEGFVLGHRNIGEANRSITLFTRDFGLVRAAAQSIRKETSKLRFSLQDYTYTRIDLVRGRDIWRITNAEKKETSIPFREYGAQVKVFARISRLLISLCAGEEENEELYDVVSETYHALTTLSIDEDLKTLEAVCVFKILLSLGYVPDVLDMERIINTPYTHEGLQTLYALRPMIISHINQAIQETHL
jgi:DNA repair protein RecO (recombination protein O)